MFQLDKEVDAWCATLFADRCRPEDNIDELKDHLYSEIEALVASGQSEKEAFYKATERIGNLEDLTSEYEKNRTAWSKFCAILTHDIDSQGNATMSMKKTFILTSLSLLIYFILTTRVDAIANDPAISERINNMLFFFYLAVMFAIFGTNNQRSVREEWACLRRKLGFSKSID